jgi:hypothetical protein
VDITHFHIDQRSFNMARIVCVSFIPQRPLFAAVEYLEQGINLSLANKISHRLPTITQVLQSHSLFQVSDLNQDVFEFDISVPLTLEPQLSYWIAITVVTEPGWTTKMYFCHDVKLTVDTERVLSGSLTNHQSDSRSMLIVRERACTFTNHHLYTCPLLGS